MQQTNFVRANATTATGPQGRGRGAWRAALAGVAMGSLAMAVPAMADHGHTKSPSPQQWQQPRHWQHGSNIHHFHEQHFDHWRSGQWHHGVHNGRLAWWWTFGDLWYPYVAPTYPYPDPYRPSEAPLPAPAPAPYYYYYCQDPAGYYPYVAECPGGWQAVAPAPQQ